MSHLVKLSALALALTFAVSGCGGTGALPQIDATSSAIIGGTNDTADPAVVLIYMTVPGQQGGALCTGELVSPHVVLTAAHCAGGEDPSTAATATWQVYTGTDFNQVTSAQDPQLLAAQGAHFDPSFNVNNLQGGNDVGVVILQNALTTIQPLQFNRTPLDQSVVGKNVRFVGYGLNDAVNQQGAGVKRQVQAPIASVDNMLIGFTDPMQGTCNGDSGGPAFLTIGGKELIVGLTSYGDNLCQQEGYDTNIATYTSFVDQYIQQYDPQYNPNPSPSPTAPPQTQAPTQPAAQQPGAVASTASAAGAPLGAACQKDSDCSTQSCGLGDSGNLVCTSGGNAEAGALGGCSAAPGGVDGGLAGFALVWLLGLALKRRAFLPQRN